MFVALTCLSSRRGKVERLGAIAISRHLLNQVLGAVGVGRAKGTKTVTAKHLPELAVPPKIQEVHCPASNMSMVRLSSPEQTIRD